MDTTYQKWPGRHPIRYSNQGDKSYSILPGGGGGGDIERDTANTDTPIIQEIMLTGLLHRHTYTYTVTHTHNPQPPTPCHSIGTRDHRDRTPKSGLYMSVRQATSYLLARCLLNHYAARARSSVDIWGDKAVTRYVEF